MKAGQDRELEQQFASDNYAGICPEAWGSMAEANAGHVTSYGDDPWTGRASNAFRKLFEVDCEVFFVFNGTAANSLALASLCQSYHGVICCDAAHVETDECGAPEFFSNGSKLLVAHSVDGKLTPDAIRELATKRQDIHYPKPRVVTITTGTRSARSRSRRSSSKPSITGISTSHTMRSTGLSASESSAAAPRGSCLPGTPTGSGSTSS